MTKLVIPVCLRRQFCKKPISQRTQHCQIGKQTIAGSYIPFAACLSFSLQKTENEKGCQKHPPIFILQLHKIQCNIHNKLLSHIPLRCDPYDPHQSAAPRAQSLQRSKTAQPAYRPAKGLLQLLRSSWMPKRKT